MRDVPPALAAAVARALARDPARRYADAAEMEDALRDGLAGVAPHRGPRRHARAAARRRGDADADRTQAAPRSAAPAPPLQPVDEPPAPPRARAPRARRRRRRAARAAAPASGSRSCS